MRIDEYVNDNYGNRARDQTSRRTKIVVVALLALAIVVYPKAALTVTVTVAVACAILFTAAVVFGLYKKRYAIPE